jgi:hypothetical protein
MNNSRLIAGAILCAALCATASADTTGVAPQWRAPRTADGHPDLQGTWTNATITPFERPEKYGERLVLSEQEADEHEQQEAVEDDRHHPVAQRQRAAAVEAEAPDEAGQGGEEGPAQDDAHQHAPLLDPVARIERARSFGCATLYDLRR